jgi:Beta propeller domain
MIHARSSITFAGTLAGTLGGLALCVVALAACKPAPSGADENRPQAGPRPGVQTPPAPREDLVTFASDRELRRYIDELEQRYRAQSMRLRRGAAESNGQGFGSSSADPAAAEPSPSPPPEADKAAEGESITNTQEANVDEGGIVKVHGDHLVVLRRGRLFTIRIGDSALAPVSMIDVFPPGTKPDAWYDEMLIEGDTIVVIGFSYGAGATEIGLFDIDAAGGLRYRDTYYLRSNDYYSSRNYASRLIGKQLIFYMPYTLVQARWDNGEPRFEASLPAFRHHGKDDWQQIITSSQIYRPIQTTDWPVLHTVVTCDLSRSTPGCTAQSVIGPSSRSFYVSSNAVYVWVGGGYQPHGSAAAVKSSDTPADAVVYRMPLIGGPPGAVRVWGTPTDQFSFKESASRNLHVLVRSAGGGDGMWGGEVTEGEVALLELPAAMFSTQVEIAGRTRYARLPRPERGWSLQNRFVGDYVLYGTGSSWGWYDQEHDPRVFVHPYAKPGQTTVLSLPHGVDRIEAMGNDAVVVGTDGKSLHFSAVDLSGDDGGEPRLAGRFTQPGASQGETRSHGFFYKPTSESEGVLGLPIRSGGRPGYAQLAEGSASVLYLRVADLAFQRLGALAARSRHVNDRCVASCVDWYGNARPIFLRGRVFALLGYEIVEGRIQDGGISEIGRVNFFNDLRGR